MLADSSYGKSGVRLVRLARRGDRHDLRDLTIAIRFEGDYDAAYVEGDNRDVLPTDTMKNTVYAFAAREPVDDPETFGLSLCEHFLERNPKANRVTVDLVEHVWRRIEAGGRDSGSAFLRHGPEKRTAQVRVDHQEAQVRAGVADLLVLKTSQSAFSGFPRDEYTTLPETRDRLLATSLSATWRYDAGVAYGTAWRAVRHTLLETFATHASESVQHTLHAMGQTVLDAVPEVAEIHLVMPNRHHLPVNLEPFGLENRNEVFVPTDEPFGLIQATVRRP
jgi:urate oxidase